MVDSTQSTRGLAAVNGISPALPAAKGAASVASSSGADFQFRGLLERLENDARRLHEQSTDVKDSKELAGALDKAQASLQDALTLSDRLLEAYRAAMLRAGDAPNDESSAKHASATTDVQGRKAIEFTSRKTGGGSSANPSGSSVTR